jgi:hypothetical protein
MLSLPLFVVLPRRLLCLIAATIVLGGCTGPPSRTPRIVTPTDLPVMPSPTAELLHPTATPTPLPSPTPTVTPWPTVDPLALRATADAGLEQAILTAGEARIVCLRHEDLDADGAPEWLVLAHDPGEGLGRLDAFVLDGGESYVLRAAPPEPGKTDVGFGQAATCELVVRDVNASGVPEIAIFGHAGGNLTLMHLFAWDGADYRRLGFFSGDAGVRLVRTAGALEEEIWEGYRVGSAPDLAWYVVHTWRNDTYGWTSDHYDWYFADRPQAHPTHSAETVVISFYLALNDRDIPGAYGLLWSEVQPPYGDWAIGYATTLQVRVGGVHLIPGSAGEQRARVAAMVTSWDNESGVIVARIWNVEWDVIHTGEGWRLLTSTAEQLEEWVVPFWSE